MLDYGIDRARLTLRQSLREAQAQKISADNAAVDDAISYFDRQTDLDTVRGKLKSRFATTVSRTKELDGGTESGYEIYVKGETAAQIDADHYETVTSGVGNKIVSALANLFTQPTQSWSFLSGDSAADDAAALIEQHRKAGGASAALVNCDFLSCAVNTGFLLLDWVGGHLKYSVVSPTALHTIYHETITDDGVKRGVDYSELDDATAVVIQLSGSVTASPDQGQYLAIFGRSEEYQYGRYVIYRASRWDNIPEVDKGGIDFRLDSGEIANPLSWFAAQNSDIIVPEYPIIKLDGGFSRIMHGLSETTLSLFNNAVEIDVAYSRLLKDSLSAARGTYLVYNEMPGTPLPPSLEGNVALHTGQRVEVVGRDATNASTALDVLSGLIVSVGNGYSVPDYHLISDSPALTSPSGVSLLIKAKPYEAYRNYRVEINSHWIDRLYAIESGLIEVYTGDQSLRGVEQVWDPGNLDIPEDPAAKTARLKADLDAGFIDYVMSIKERHSLPTIDDAIALIEQMRERSAQYPAPGQQQRRTAQPVGLIRQ